MCSGLVFTQREDFPEENTEGPDVTLAGIHLVKDALRRHPLQRQADLTKQWSGRRILPERCINRKDTRSSIYVGDFSEREAERTAVNPGEK